MKRSLRVGYSFGFTSGIITTLGLVTGLAAGTQSQLAVIGGIFTIAIADGLSDAFGIHMSEEAQKQPSSKEVWESTISTFIAKFGLALSFLVPVILLPLTSAVLTSIVWGLSVIIVLSARVAKFSEKSPWKPMAEHLIIASIVVLITYGVGIWTSMTFN